MEKKKKFFSFDYGVVYVVTNEKNFFLLIIASWT